MKYSKLLTVLNSQKLALMAEEHFTAKRMFESDTEKETLILLRKIEELQDRQEALQSKINTIVFWNKRLDDEKKSKRKSK